MRVARICCPGEWEGGQVTRFSFGEGIALSRCMTRNRVGGKSPAWLLPLLIAGLDCTIAQ